MWSILINEPDTSGLLSAKLWELGTTGIEETPEGLRAYFEDAINPEAIHCVFSNAAIQTDLPPVIALEAPDRDPIFVGTRFVIVPVHQAEIQQQATPDLIVLPIDALMAFGSGRHESTQLCLEALEHVVRPGDSVFDVGCGSGVLALAAQKLGALRVVAADIDEAAISVAHLHFKGPLIVGSADCFATESADIVISNITGKVIDLIASDLNRILKPTGSLILSGFAERTAPQQFKPQRIFSTNGWVCWTCNRDLVSAPASSPQIHSAQWWL